MKKSLIFVIGLVVSLSLIATSFHGPIGFSVQAADNSQFIIGESEEPDTLDPNNTGMIESLRILQFVTEPLLTLDKNLKPVPLLAKSWEWSNERKEVTFKLKEGIKFHDGEPLTAEAVKMSLQRFRKMSSMSYMLDKVKEIKVEDKHTFTLKLSAQAPNLMNYLADGHMSILSPKMLENRKDEDIGVKYLSGTGPYKLSDWIHGSRIVLKKYDDYHHAPDFIENKGPAHIDAIVVRIIPEGSVRIAELRSGNIDLTWNIPPMEVKNLKNSENIKLEMAPTYNVQYLGLNSKRPGLDNQAVRVAIAHAINKTALLENAWSGIGAVAHGPINQAIIGYWEGVKDIAYKYNLEEAKQLLGSHGWVDSDGDGIREKEGVELKYSLLTGTTPERRRLGATMVQQMLKQIGIKVSVNTLEFGTAFSKAKNGEHDMVMFANVWWLGSSFLRFTNHSGVPTNFARIEDPFIDHYIELAINEPAPEERQWALNKVQELIVDKAGFIPLISEVQMIAAKDSVSGLDELTSHPWWPALMKALVLDKK